MKTVRELAQAIAPEAVRAAGAIRRMAVTLTAKTLWQLSGFDLPDGGKETVKAEVFGGIGFYSRPPAGTKPEAIVVMVGDAGAPAVIAVRDEKTRAAIAGAIAAGETAVYTDKVLVYLKADRTIEARSSAGVAQPTIRGTTYRAAEDAFFAALDTLTQALAANAAALATAIPTLTGSPAQVAAYTASVSAVATALSAFNTAVTNFSAGAAGYLTTVLKGE